MKAIYADEGALTRIPREGIVARVGRGVLYYSNGLVEAHDPNSEMFGFPRLRALTTEQGKKRALVDSVLESFAPSPGRDGAGRRYSFAGSGLGMQAPVRGTRRDQAGRLPTNNARPSKTPDRSPDDKKIAFESARSGNREPSEAIHRTAQRRRRRKLTPLDFKKYAIWGMRWRFPICYRD